MESGCKPRRTTGGKGNLGKVLERDRHVYAAGVPSSDEDQHLEDCLKHYLLEDHVQALMQDAIIPPTPPPILFNNPKAPDQRNAGFYTQVKSIINPPVPTKYQLLAADMKETIYKSYWKKRVGQVPDPTPMLPDGFDIVGTTFGIKSNTNESLYDIIMPKDPLPDRTPESKEAGVQTKRNYCIPAFDKDSVFGMPNRVDPHGRLARNALREDDVILGKSLSHPINTIQADYISLRKPLVARTLAPNENIECVPEGHAFGKLGKPDSIVTCLTYCHENPEREFFKECVKYLNVIRLNLAKRYTPMFFHNFYLKLKYIDTERSGWLPKEIVYNYCRQHHIRFEIKYLEPLLSEWAAFDGQKIGYKTLCNVLTFQHPFPDLPRVPDVMPESLNYLSTYQEMVCPGQENFDNVLRAGLPSGRYMDKDYPVTPEMCCDATNTCLPQESDARACITPSVKTLCHVSHRNMYARREPHVVKRVFEAAGETFTDKSFSKVWEAAKKFSSQGLVCFETFQRALENYKNEKETEKNEN